VKQLHLSGANDLIEEVAPVKNSSLLLVKPQYGLWTSTWDEAGKTSDWVDWCVDASFGTPYEQQWFLLNVKPDARIYQIDNSHDLRNLFKSYRRQFTGPMAALNTLGYLDYEQISQDFDAIHLTAQGQQHARFGADNLYGWDCESTIWFRWCFTSVEKIER
jgi:hypothetical protein